jgi:ribonuclease Z
LVDEDTLIDCGAGSVRNLREIGLNLAGVSRLLITHCHADHIGDLVSLLWAMELDRRRDRLTILGYGDVETLTRNLLKLMHTPEEFSIFGMNFKSLSGLEKFDDIQVCLTIHKPTNLAYRIERDGRKICHTGDTAFYEPLAKFASNCDLMIHDSVFLNSQKDIATLTNHSTAGEAGKIAKMAGVDTLVLFHIFPYNRNLEGEFVKQATEEFDGKIIVAKDFQTLEV